MVRLKFPCEEKCRHIYVNILRREVVFSNGFSSNSTDSHVDHQAKPHDRKDNLERDR